MAKADQGLELDIDSLGEALGPAGLHAFLDEVIVQPVLAREARLERTRQEAARARQDAVISPKGLFAIEQTFDAFDLQDLVQDEGLEALSDEGMLKDVAKRNPYTVVRARPRKASIIVPAWKPQGVPVPRDGGPLIVEARR